MTQAIKTQQEIMREALAVLTFIEVLENVGLTKDRYYFEQRTKYSALMAKLTTELLEVCSNVELDNYIQSLPSMVVNATANGLIEPKPHNVFSSQVDKACKDAQRNFETFTEFKEGL